MTDDEFKKEPIEQQEEYFADGEKTVDKSVDWLEVILVIGLIAMVIAYAVSCHYSKLPK